MFGIFKKIIKCSTLLLIISLSFYGCGEQSKIKNESEESITSEEEIIDQEVNSELEINNADSNQNDIIKQTNLNNVPELKSKTEAKAKTKPQTEQKLNNNNCQHEYTKVIAKQATCTEAGTTELICTKCGLEKYIHEPNAIGHKYNETITKNSTCTSSGEKIYTCENCQHNYTETIRAIGHSFNGWTITEDAHLHTCSRCGFNESLPHVWKNDECEVCGIINLD